MDEEGVSFDGDSDGDDVLGVTEPGRARLPDDLRCRVDEVTSVVSGRGHDREMPAGPRDPVRGGKERAGLEGAVGQAVGQARRAPADGSAGSRLRFGRGGSERRWRRDQERDLAEVVGEAAVHLVGAARPHLHVAEALARQCGAELSADVLGEREVRDARDGSTAELGGGAQGGGIGGERFGDQRSPRDFDLPLRGRTLTTCPRRSARFCTHVVP
ncbi:hypothetical protein [Actinomadura nitritigenes]|uniref:hypothetical protein n=1 Tax=Actinomadura nitritigenes TaxID=134602 RepID=UPI003D8A99B1